MASDFIDEYVFFPIKAILYLIALPFVMGFIFLKHCSRIFAGEKVDQGEYLISIFFLAIMVWLVLSFWGSGMPAE